MTISESKKAALIRKTTAALLDAIPPEVRDDSMICGLSVATLVGLIARTSNDPEKKLRAIMDAARAVVSGEFDL